MSILTIDGIGYDGIGIERLTRSASLQDGKNADTMISGDYIRDLQGTFYDYTMIITGLETGSRDYDNLYCVLTAPVNSHTVVLPYGQSTITLEVYIDNMEDALLAMSDIKNWWGSLTVKLNSVQAKRVPEAE